MSGKRKGMSVTMHPLFIVATVVEHHKVALLASPSHFVKCLKTLSPHCQSNWGMFPCSCVILARTAATLLKSSSCSRHYWLMVKLTCTTLFDFNESLCFNFIWQHCWMRRGWFCFRLCLWCIFQLSANVHLNFFFCCNNEPLHFLPACVEPIKVFGVLPTFTTRKCIIQPISCCVICVKKLKIGRKTSWFLTADVCACVCCVGSLSMV